MVPARWNSLMLRISSSLRVATSMRASLVGTVPHPVDVFAVLRPGGEPKDASCIDVDVLPAPGFEVIDGRPDIFIGRRPALTVSECHETLPVGRPARRKHLLRARHHLHLAGLQVHQRDVPILLRNGVQTPYGAKTSFFPSGDQFGSEPGPLTPLHRLGPATRRWDGIDPVRIGHRLLSWLRRTRGVCRPATSGAHGSAGRLPEGPCRCRRAGISIVPAPGN
jgi:hypothetical protein